jgi:hypothetical protein
MLSQISLSRIQEDRPQILHDTWLFATHNYSRRLSQIRSLTRKLTNSLICQDNIDTTSPLTRLLALQRRFRREGPDTKYFVIYYVIIITIDRNENPFGRIDEIKQDFKHFHFTFTSTSFCMDILLAFAFRKAFTLDSMIIETALRKEENIISTLIMRFTKNSLPHFWFMD